jgi:hypothetical protein
VVRVRYGGQVCVILMCPRRRSQMRSAKMEIMRRSEPKRRREAGPGAWLGEEQEEVDRAVWWEWVARRR